MNNSPTLPTMLADFEVDFTNFEIKEVGDYGRMIFHRATSTINGKTCFVAYEEKIFISMLIYELQDLEKGIKITQDDKVKPYLKEAKKRIEKDLKAIRKKDKEDVFEYYEYTPRIFTNDLNEVNIQEIEGHLYRIEINENNERIIIYPSKNGNFELIYEEVEEIKKLAKQWEVAKKEEKSKIEDKLIDIRHKEPRKVFDFLKAPKLHLL